MRVTTFCVFWTLVFLGTATFATGQAQYKVLYSFGANGPSDGYDSLGKLLRDAQGNLYGTTAGGGSGTSGTVFELSPSSGGNWTETILYNFCSQPSCSDGAYPGAGLVSDQAGNLYGSTLGGGASLIWGAVFELSPPSAPGGSWTETVLWSFGGDSEGDGCGPRKLIFDAAGNLYGTTSNCGTGAHPSGTVFELSPASDGTWTETLLYTFNGTNKINPYGSYPVAGVTFDNAGNIYGTTSFGGKLFGGTVYELSPNPSGGWSETVLHAFSEESMYSPLSALAFDQEGNLYGTASRGGVSGNGCGQYGCGGIFKLTKTSGGWSKASLSFTGLNGGSPAAGVILDQKHKTAYGTTQYGGANANGTVFSAHGATVGVLYSFCAQENCADGSQPLTALTPDESGNLYGTTSTGGAYNQGVVFEIHP
ncbi:MAG: choice-of-anchor tandem repeat GloVer-containing protein [Terriglobales bacterium]